MSKESLDKFVNERFLCDEITQNRLKATDSLDDFANVMVNLGAENYSFTAEEVKALVQSEIDKQKERLDDESKELLDQAMATNWKDGQFVETGIQNLRGDKILPIYS